MSQKSERQKKLKKIFFIFLFFYFFFDMKDKEGIFPRMFVEFVEDSKPEAAQQARKQEIRPPKQLKKIKEINNVGVSVSPYYGDDNGQIQFEKDQTIFVEHLLDSGWSYGFVVGESNKGIFPSECVLIIDDEGSPPSPVVRRNEQPPNYGNAPSNLSGAQPLSSIPLAPPDVLPPSDPQVTFIPLPEYQSHNVNNFPSYPSQSLPQPAPYSQPPPNPNPSSPHSSATLPFLPHPHWQPVDPSISHYQPSPHNQYQQSPSLPFHSVSNPPFQNSPPSQYPYQPFPPQYYSPVPFKQNQMAQAYPIQPPSLSSQHIPAQPPQHIPPQQSQHIPAQLPQHIPAQPPQHIPPQQPQHIPVQQLQHMPVQQAQPIPLQHPQAQPIPVQQPQYIPMQQPQPISLQQAHQFPPQPAVPIQSPQPAAYQQPPFVQPVQSQPIPVQQPQQIPTEQLPPTQSSQPEFIPVQSIARESQGQPTIPPSSQPSIPTTSFPTSDSSITSILGQPPQQPLPVPPSNQLQSIPVHQPQQISVQQPQAASPSSQAFSVPAGWSTAQSTDGKIICLDPSAAQPQIQNGSQKTTYISLNTKPLRPGWVQMMDPASGIVFYVDHNTKTTCWEYPHSE